MSYYQGDFYQGDPGFLSFLGKGLGLAGSFIPGVGGIAAKAGSLISRIGKSRAGQMVAKHPTLTAAGTAGTIGALGGFGTQRLRGRMGAAQVGPAGMGARVRMPRGGGRLGGHRRMRVTNIKALRRAIRRAKGFEKMARKVMHFTSPRKAHGRAIFRVRKRKSV